MKNTLMAIFLSLMLNNCSSSVIKNVNFEEIKKIKNKDYIIVAFSGYQKSTDTIFEAQINSYSNIEKIINNHCKNEGKNTYKTNHYNEHIKYTYGNGIVALGQKFWCAKNLKEAGNLYIRYLKDPPDIYLSRSQIMFKKDSIKWIKKGKTNLIENHIIYHYERSGLTLYSKNDIAIKPKKNTVKNKKKTNSNLIRE